MTTTPPTGQQLADRIAEALRVAAYDCDGTCGLGEHECDAQHPIQVAVLHHDVIATVYGDIADLAAVAAAAVQPELDRLAAELERMTALNESKAESIRKLNAECKALRSERKEARRQAARSRSSFLAQSAARLRSYCPEHGDDSLSTAFLECHCPAADELDRTTPAAAVPSA